MCNIVTQFVTSEDDLNENVMAQSGFRQVGTYILIVEIFDILCNCKYDIANENINEYHLVRHPNCQSVFLILRVAKVWLR